MIKKSAIIAHKSMLPSYYTTRLLTTITNTRRSAEIFSYISAFKRSIKDREIMDKYYQPQ